MKPDSHLAGDKPEADSSSQGASACERPFAQNSPLIKALHNFGNAEFAYGAYTQKTDNAATDSADEHEVRVDKAYTALRHEITKMLNSQFAFAMTQPRIASAETMTERWRKTKMAWCASLENWWNLAADKEKKKAYSSSIEADTWKANRIRDLEADIANLSLTAKALEKVCDESLDMRPEFLAAVSSLHTALAASPRCPKCGSDEYQEFHHDGSRGTPECWWWECADCGHKTQPE